MINLYSSINARKQTALAVAVLGVGLVIGGRAQAETLYATSISGSQIDQVDTVANTVTTYLNTPSAADSIIFDSAGNVIYTELYTGDVVRYDPNTTTSTTLATSLSTPADMVLEPGGNSMLVSEFSGGNIDRITFPNTVTTLSTGLGNPEGLAYDGTRLFANIGYRGGGPTGKQVAEIDPTTGNILAVSPGLNSLDGLTYDPYSGLLYASSVFGNIIYSIDPNNLNNVQNATGTLGIVPGPDGITTDGVGDIFIASSYSIGDSHVYQLNLISHTLTQDNFVSGLDDLAPASGAGSIPEPASIALLAIGAIPLLGRRSRRSV